MQTLIHDMLIWLAAFFGVSLILILAVRAALKKVRQRHVDRVKEIEARCRQTFDELGLPLTWRVSPQIFDAPDFRRVQLFRWMAPLAILAAGIMWSATGQEGWNSNGAGFGISAACTLFVVLTMWLNWRRETTVPRQSRQLALALRCWAVRVEAGISGRSALEQSAKQLRRVDPELARQLEAAAIPTDDVDAIKQAFLACSSGLAEQLAKIVHGQSTDPGHELRSIANRLDDFYLTQSLARTRLIESWLKYPLALCLVPAVNLIVFSPAVTDLIEKFGRFRLPDARQVQPQRPLIPVPEEVTKPAQ